MAVMRVRLTNEDAEMVARFSRPGESAIATIRRALDCALMMSDRDRWMAEVERRLSELERVVKAGAPLGSKVSDSEDMNSVQAGIISFLGSVDD